MAGLSHSLPRAGRRTPLAARLTVVVPIYAVAIAAAEAVTTYVDTTLGTAFHGALLFTLVTHYVAAGEGPGPEDRAPGIGDPAAALPALALVPLLRIVSLTTPVEDLSRLWWYAMAGAPLLLGALLTLRAVGIRLRDLALAPRSWPPQVVIALAGLPLGLAAYEIGDPGEIVANPGAGELLVGSLVLIVLVGFTEELVFRGVLQRSLSATLGPLPGLAIASGLFGATYLGSQSAQYVALMGLTGLAFGLCMQRMGSIVGIGLAHGLLSAGAVLVWPALLG